MRHLPSYCAAAVVAVTSLTLNAQSGTKGGSLPQTMRFCAFSCATLILQGDHYGSIKDNVEDRAIVSTFNVVQFSREAVIINRVESTGRSATLTGRISATGESVVNGKITWNNSDGTRPAFPYELSWGNALNSAILNTVVRGSGDAARSNQEPVSMPNVMHFCAVNCFTLNRNGNAYEVDPQTASPIPGWQSVWTVKSFTPQNVVIDRRDTAPNTAAYNGEYTGQISADGNRLINVTFNGDPINKSVFTWGLALSYTPGSNRERDKALHTAGISVPGNDPSLMLLALGLAAFSSMDSDTGSSGSKGSPQAIHRECDPSGSQGCMMIPNGATAEEWFKKPDQ
jgi:hypothetical protein